MTHLTDLQLSMAADNALATAELAVISQHTSECDTCRQRLEAYQLERNLLVDGLATDSFEVPALEMPKFKKPVTLRNFAIANLATGVLIWFAQFLWKTLFGELLVNAATQVTAFYLPDATEIAMEMALYFTLEGTRMIENYLSLIVLAMIALGIVAIVAAMKRSHLLVSFSLALAVAAGLVTPMPASALEIRRSEDTVRVNADEVINDTLIAVGETVIVDADVKGNLITAARRIIINGTVEGTLVAAGKSVSIEGEVAGTLVTANETLDLRNTTVGGDFWSASGNITLDKDSAVTGNTVIATERASLDGRTGRDLYAFGETVELSGAVGEDFEVYAERIRLLDDASITGDVRARIHNQDNFEQSPTATIGGTTELMDMPDEFERSNRYETSEYYLRQAFRLVSAFIVGAVALWLIPVLRDETLEGGMEGFKTAGIGLLTLVSVPVLAVFTGATVVGIPLAILGFLAWTVAIYLAKIVVASMIGQMILENSDKGDSLLLTLALGLVIVIVATALPAIGGLLNFIMTIVGLGLITQLAFSYVSRDPA